MVITNYTHLHLCSDYLHITQTKIPNKLNAYDEHTKGHFSGFGQPVIPTFSTVEVALLQARSPIPMASNH